MLERLTADELAKITEAMQQAKTNSLSMFTLNVEYWNQNPPRRAARYISYETLAKDPWALILLGYGCEHIPAIRKAELISPFGRLLITFRGGAEG